MFMKEVIINKISMKKILSFLLILVSISSFSQLSRTQLITNINTNINTNGTQKITGALLNQTLIEIVNSDLNKTSDQYIGGSGTNERTPRFVGYNTIEEGSFTDDGSNVTLPSGNILKIDGQFRITPSAGAAKVLTSDADGYATWQTPASSGITGTLNYIPLFTSSTTIGSSYLKQEGANISLTSGKYISGSDSTKIRMYFGTTGAPYGMLSSNGGSGTWGGQFYWSGGYAQQGAINKLATKATTFFTDTLGNVEIYASDSVYFESAKRFDIKAARLQINIPSKANGYVLTSDANGMATWQAATGGGVTSVSGTTNRINSSGGATPVIDISSSYVGQSSITTLGTIGTGVWNGTAIGSQYGGTGQNYSASSGILNFTTGTASLLTAPSGTIVGTSDAQTLTNKTFTDNVTTFQDDGDNTKKAQFQLSGITTATTRTYTLPDVSTTVVGRSGTGVNNFVSRWTSANELTSTNFSVVNNICGINSGASTVALEMVNGGSTTIDTYGRFFAGGDFYIYSGSTSSGAANRFGVSVRNRLFLESSHVNGLYIGSTTTAPIVFNTNNAEIARFISTGQFGIGVSAPTATLHLKAGTASANSGPLQFTSGAFETTPRVGLFEFLTDDLTFTGTTGTTRKAIADYSYRGITALRTLDGSDELVNITSGTFTVTLPSAVGFNKKFTVKNSGTGIISLATTSSQTIDGAAASEYTLLQGDHYELRSNGSNWIIISGGRKIYTYTVTIPAATFRTIGSAPVDITPSITVPTNCILTVDVSSIVIRKKSGAPAYDFADDVYVGYYAFALKSIDQTVFNASSSNLIFQSSGATFTGQASVIGEPIIVTTNGAVDATQGGGDVVITYRYYLSNLN